MKNSVSLIIPAYNESARLESSLKEILHHTKNLDFETELIVVDDGSTDDTAHIAENFFQAQAWHTARVIRYEENRGKGFAVKTGLLAAKYDIALFMDADLSTPLSEISKVIEPIQTGEFDVTFGSRALDRRLIETRQSWRREQGGKAFNLLVKALTKLPFWDTQCGFKAFKMSKFRPLLEVMKIDRFGFDVEFLFVAQMCGLKLQEIPVRWAHCEGTKVNFLRDSWRMFNEVRQIRNYAKSGEYKFSSKEFSSSAMSVQANEQMSVLSKTAYTFSSK